MKFYVISFDCESTGLSVLQDQIVELGAVTQLWDTVSGDIVDLPPFTRYARPTLKSMCGRAEEITGITMDMLRDKPAIRAVLDEFRVHLDTICPDAGIPRILVSYNGFAYDLPLVVAELERSGCAKGFFRQLRIERAIDVLLFGKSCLDTTRLRRKANGACSYKLGDVYSSLCGRALDGAHGALADSRAVLKILSQDTIAGKFRELMTAPDRDDACCRNPMAVVREALDKVRHRPKRGQSRTISDMLQRHKRARAQNQ